MATGPTHVRFDHGPGARVGHQRGEHRVVELVAAAHRTVGAQQRRTGKREIADGVKGLVTDELVSKTRTLRVEDARVGDDQRVLERSAKRVAGAPQLRYVAHEAEGAGAGDLASEGLRWAIERQVLASDQRMVERDLSLDPQAAGIRPQLAIAGTGGDPYRLEHADKAARRIERLDPGAINRHHEWGGAAVHDRNFGSVDLDHRVVPTAHAQRRQHMLGGRHQRTGCIPQNGGKFGGGDGADVGANLALAAVIEARADEPDASSGVSWMQGHCYRKAGMDADPREPGLVPQ